MTSDAKIGLLLGLVFIFVIAFIINGLPSFRGDKNTNELTTKMAGSQNNPPGLGAKERKAQETINLAESAKNQILEEGQLSTANKEDIRAIVPLPTGDSIVREILAGKTTDNLLTPAANEEKPPILGPIANEKNEATRAGLVETAWPKTYIVSDGDNMAEIAKKLYGEQEGNKRINITRIFEANKNLLKSVDEIYVGQKLTIPAPASLADNNNKPTGLPSSMFEKVKSIGQRHLLPDSSGSPKPAKQYVVQEGDSLWKIASERLGNGNRYKEISNLNTDILKDEDNLVVGMRLKLPTQ